MAYNYILFDLDGTLTDPSEGITNSVMHALKKYGIEESDRSALYKFIGPPLLTSFREFYGFSEEQAKEAIEFYRERFRDKGIFENKMYEGIPELLKNLKSAGKTLIVATSKPTVFAEKILEHFGLSEYFSLTVGSELDGTRSKKDEVIAHALKKAGIKSTAECVMIGDREHDVFGALKNNIDSIGVLYGYGSRAELMSAGAVYIAASVREIEKIVICRRTLSLTSKIKDFKAECCT